MLELINNNKENQTWHIFMEAWAETRGNPKWLEPAQNQTAYKPMWEGGIVGLRLWLDGKMVGKLIALTFTEQQEVAGQETEFY